MTCDGYWFEEEAPPAACADQGPIHFVIETGAQPLEFRFYIPKGHPCGVVSRSGEHGNYFSKRLQDHFLNEACRRAELFWEPEAHQMQIQKYARPPDGHGTLTSR